MAAARGPASSAMGSRAETSADERRASGERVRLRYDALMWITRMP